MTTTTEAPTATPQGATSGELLQALLAATARQTATKAVVDDLRAELHARAVRHVQTEGTAPRWRLAGVGEALLTDPQERVVVANGEAFAAWAVEHHPEHVTATLAIPAPALEAVLNALEGVLDPEDRPVTLSADAHWTAEVIGGCAVVPGDVEPQVVSADGTVVEGVAVTRQAATLSVRLDREAKNRAAAEAASAEGVARLTAPMADLPAAEADLPGDVVHQLTARA